MPLYRGRYYAETNYSETHREAHANAPLANTQPELVVRFVRFDALCPIMSRGKFITIEGSEGVGKSTNVAAVAAALSKRGVDFYQTREPGGTPLAEALRGLLLQEWQEPVDALTELLLVFTARNQHIVNELEPRLQKGQWIVCDRFTDASYAYQGSARGVDRQVIEKLEEWVQRGLQPDLTLYLDLDPETAFSRIADREHDRLEQESRPFFNAVRAGYLARAAALERIVTIDASRSVAQVGAAVTAAVDAFVEAQTEAIAPNDRNLPDGAQADADENSL